MGKWKEVMLTDVTLKIGDGLHGTPNYDDKGDYYFINGNNLYQGKIVIKEETKKVNKTEFEKHKKNLSDKTILLGINGTIGNVALYNNEKCILGKSACYINVNENIYRSYLYYNLLNKDFQIFIEGIATGTTIPNVPLKGLREYQLLLPPLPEQKRIAEVLSGLDDKINLLHLNNKTLDQLAETLFRQWFLEEKEEDCKKSTLGELVKVIDNRGKTPSFTETKTDYPIIEVNALNGKNRYIDYSLIKKYVDEHTYNNWFRAGHPKLNDILFSTVGSIGEMSMLLNPIGTIAQNIVALRAEKISPYYLYQYLMSIQDEIKEFDIGSVQPSIKVTHLTKIEIPMPDSNKVNLFDNQAKDICNKISINYNQIQRLETLRNTLLPKLMSGVVTVEN